MDSTFVEGMAAFISTIIVFCGSVWLVLAVVLGARLAYWITATITLGFVFIMGVVWSLSPLGPVGQLPEWNPVTIAGSVDELEFGGASSYPDAPWKTAGEDKAEQTQAAEVEGKAVSYLEEAVVAGELDAFASPNDAVLDKEQTRLLERDGTLYGAVTFVAKENKDGGPAYAVVVFDPGNPLSTARQITAGTALLFGLHLFGLNRSEKRSKREEDEGAPQ